MKTPAAGEVLLVRVAGPRDNSISHLSCPRRSEITPSNNCHAACLRFRSGPVSQGRLAFKYTTLSLRKKHFRGPELNLFALDNSIASRAKPEECPSCSAGFHQEL